MPVLMEGKIGRDCGPMEDSDEQIEDREGREQNPGEALKVTIDGAVADDLKLMCDWSENDLSYVVNLLLGFAIAQSEDFQKYKSERAATSMTSHRQQTKEVSA